MLVPLFYISLCVFYGLFKLKLAGYYALYKEHTDAPTLIFHALYMIPHVGTVQECRPLSATTSFNL